MSKETRVIWAIVQSIVIATFMLYAAVVAIYHDTLLSWALAAFETFVAIAVVVVLIPYEIRQGSWTPDEELSEFDRWVYTTVGIETKEATGPP